jgi:flagellar hook-associated protein 1
MTTGLTTVLDIGSSGLTAATEGMQTVSNNTANVNTPGYNQEVLNQTFLPSTDMPAGGLGMGTDVTSIERVFNQFIFQQIVGATSTNSAAQLIQNNAQDLSSIFPVASGGEGGLGDILNSFFTAANTVTQDPASLPDRDVFIGAAQSTASEFHALGAALQSDVQTQNGQISGTVTQINELTSQIANLNKAIAEQTGATGQATNSLLDQRDELIQQLSQQIGISVIPGSNGAEDVYAAGGAALVSDFNSYNLKVSFGAYLDGNVEVTYGPTGQDLSNTLSGGQLGGILAFRTQLISVENSIGALATAFADAINTQQAQGLDLNGNLGPPLFSLAAPSVFAATTNTASGSITASITSASALVPDNFTVTKTSGGYVATDGVTGQTTVLGAGPSFTYDGLTLTVSGPVNVGDSFEVEPTANAALSLSVAFTDPNLIAAASPYVATPGGFASGGGIVDNNRGNVTMTVGAMVASGSLTPSTAIVPAADFGQKLVVTFTSATTFNVSTSGGTVISSGSFTAGAGGKVALDFPPPGPAGEAITVALSPGTAVAGDSYILSPGGAGNNGNMVAMAGLNAANVLSGQTFANYYSQIVTNIGNQGEEAQTASQAASGVLTSATALQQSISGVNLDEQAADLVTFQQAYQASAQVIATAQALFTDLIAAIQGG